MRPSKTALSGNPLPFIGASTRSRGVGCLCLIKLTWGEKTRALRLAPLVEVEAFVTMCPVRPCVSLYHFLAHQHPS